MTKSLRLDNESIHDQLTQMLLDLSAKRGKKLKMEDLIIELIKSYSKKH